MLKPHHPLSLPPQHPVGIVSYKICALTTPEQLKYLELEVFFLYVTSCSLVTSLNSIILYTEQCIYLFIYLCTSLFLFPKYNYNYQVKEDEIGKACRMNGGRRGKHIGYWWEIQKKRDYFKVQDVGVWIILIRILERYVWVVWTGLIWIRIGTSGGLL
jgi:Ca2+/Na+ antiporter